MNNHKRDFIKDYIGRCDNCHRNLYKDDKHYLVVWNNTDYIFCADCAECVNDDNGETHDEFAY